MLVLLVILFTAVTSTVSDVKSNTMATPCLYLQYKNSICNENSHNSKNFEVVVLLRLINKMMTKRKLQQYLKMLQVYTLL